MVSHSVMSDPAIPWTVAQQAPLSMEFSRQEYWSRLPCPSTGNLPKQGIEPRSLQCRWILCYLSHQWSPVIHHQSVRSVAQSGPTLCDPVNRSTPGLLVHHQLLERVQTHVHWVGDAIQPPHPLLSPCPPAFNLSQDQGLFQWVSSLHQVAKGYKPSPITRDKLHAWSKPIPEPIPDFVCSSLLSVWASHLVLVVKNPPANAGHTGDAGDMGLIPGSERSTGVGKSTPLQYSAWRIMWAEEPGRLQSMDLQRVGHN